jgi:hypothetical protein
LNRSCTYGPHFAKSADGCSGVREERKEGHAEPGNSQRVWSCTVVHVLIFCSRGLIMFPNVLLKFISPRTRAALSGVRGLSCTQFCIGEGDCAGKWQESGPAKQKRPKPHYIIADFL